MKTPWLAASHTQFMRLSKRLPHALLIHGEPGVGKNLFASQIVTSLLCDSPSTDNNSHLACGQCKNCVMFASNNHPDFHYLSSEWYAHETTAPEMPYAERYFEEASKRTKRKPRRVISVEQVRDLIHDFSLSQHSAKHKVALIQPADAMNTNASNALLKLLEEPNSDSILILVCDDVSQLPMTVRSRCVNLAVKTPTQPQALEWLLKHDIEPSIANKALAISSGAPLLALKVAQSNEIDNFESLIATLNALLNEGLSPIAAREACIKTQPPKRLLMWLQLIMSWLTSLSSADNPKQKDAIAAFQEQLKPLLGVGVNQIQLFSLYDDLCSIRQQDINILNPALLLDKWLITFSQRLKKP